MPVISPCGTNGANVAVMVPGPHPTSRIWEDGRDSSNGRKYAQQLEAERDW